MGAGMTHADRQPEGDARQGRHFPGRRWALATLLVAAVVARLGAAAIIRVTPLARDGQIFLSFEMQDAFTPEVRDAVLSGLNTTFAYDIELRRSTALWIDRTVNSATIAANVRYDTLTRRYHLTRRLDGRVLDTQSAEDETTVRKWLTVFDKLAVFSTRRLEPNTEYYLRVHAHTHPRNNMFRFPWDGIAASAMVKFTFMP